MITRVSPGRPLLTLREEMENVGGDGGVVVFVDDVVPGVVVERVAGVVVPTNDGPDVVGVAVEPPVEPEDVLPDTSGFVDVGDDEGRTSTRLGKPTRPPLGRPMNVTAEGPSGADGLTFMVRTSVAADVRFADVRVRPLLPFEP